MPRRMSLSHDELRRAAVDLARAIVAGEGIAALTVRRIAAGLGCAVGTVYNLFHDLDDVVLHVSADVLDDMASDLFAPGLPESPIDRLVEIARRYIRFARERGRLWAMVFAHAPAHDRPTPDWQTRRVAGLVEAARAFVAPALGPAAAPERLAATTDVLWASVHGIAALMIDDKLGFVTGTDPEALAEHLVRSVLAGSRTAPAG